jgi:O-acetyl-ADP-ribose deacetylase (regulator of RNase III)
MKAKVNKVTIQIAQDDLLAQTVACLVNPTDPNLFVNPALSALAGPSLQQACNAIGWCEVGSAVITDAGDMKMEKIIHAVGPRWGEGSERGKLANVTLQCLRLAEQSRLKSLAIPAISTGTLGYPMENCAKTMLAQIINFTFDAPRFLRMIIVCLDNPLAYQIFKAEFMTQLEDLKEAGEGEVTVV